MWPTHNVRVVTVDGYHVAQCHWFAHSREMILRQIAVMRVVENEAIGRHRCIELIRFHSCSQATHTGAPM